MSRKTVRVLAELVAAQRAEVPKFIPMFELQSTGAKDLKFKLVVSGLPVGDVVVAADSGAEKVFSAVDDAVKQIAKIAETADCQYELTVVTGSLLASSVPANMVTWAAAQVIKLGKLKTARQQVVADIDTQLGMMANWENGNPAQVAKKAEVSAQRAAVVEDIAAIDAKISELSQQ